MNVDKYVHISHCNCNDSCDNDHDDHEIKSSLISDHNGQDHYYTIHKC